jgi:hypothetical protein
MAWPTSITTWTAGQVVTATDLNEQIRDPLEFLESGTSGYLLTAQGAGAAPEWVASAAVGGDSDQIVLGTQVFS